MQVKLFSYQPSLKDLFLSGDPSGLCRKDNRPSMLLIQSKGCPVVQRHDQKPCMSTKKPWLPAKKWFHQRYWCCRLSCKNMVIYSVMPTASSDSLFWSVSTKVSPGWPASEEYKKISPVFEEDVYEAISMKNVSASASRPSGAPAMKPCRKSLISTAVILKKLICRLFNNASASCGMQPFKSRVFQLPTTQFQNTRLILFLPVTLHPIWFNPSIKSSTARCCCLRQQIPSVQMTLLLCIQVNQMIIPIKEFSQCDSVSFTYILNGCQWWTSPLDASYIRQCRRRKIRLFCRRYTVHPLLLILLPDTPHNIKIHLVCLLLSFCLHIISQFTTNGRFFRQTTF